MTAEEILKQNQLFELGENMRGIKHHEIIKSMKDYALLQIEKDRERVRKYIEDGYDADACEIQLD